MRRICLLILLGGVSLGAQGTPPQPPPQDPEAAAREALARPVSIGSVPLLIQHARYSNVAARLADALKHKQPGVRAVAARSIFVLAGSRYAGPLAEALAAERDPVAGAEMARALLAIRGAAADSEAMDAARRLGTEALDAASMTMAQSRPLDVLPWLGDLRLDVNMLPLLRRANALDPDRVGAALQTHGVEGIGDAPPDPRWTQRTEWRIPEPFVSGLDAAVAEAAGCRPKADEIAVVQIGYGPGGQVRQIRVDATRASPECRQAASALAALEIAPLGEGTANDRTDYLVHAFTREALECERRSSRGRAQRAGGNGALKEPQKLRDVRPVYPKQMIAARIEGSVIVEAIIDRAGCVNRAAVLGEPRPEFSIAALAAVAQWRYAPTLLNGEPVSVIMTVTSTFALR